MEKQNTSLFAPHHPIFNSTSFRSFSFFSYPRRTQNEHASPVSSIIPTCFSMGNCFPIFTAQNPNHVSGGSEPLSWATRIKIALEAAQGLNFLHKDEQQVIYRDFKASNILLDEKFSAKLSDFGLAKEGPTGRLTTKCDVYSFGVVLLEMISGRRALERNRIASEQNLVEWARPYLCDRRKVFRVMDTSMEGQYPQKGAYIAAAIAYQCTSDAKSSPSMAEVVSALERFPTKKQTSSNTNTEAPSPAHMSTSQMSPVRQSRKPDTSGSPLPHSMVSQINNKHLGGFQLHR